MHMYRRPGAENGRPDESAADEDNDVVGSRFE